MKQIQYILCVTLCVLSSVDLWPATSAGAGAGGSSGTGAFQLSSMPEEASAQLEFSFLHYAYQKLKKYQHEASFFDFQQEGDYLLDLREAKISYEQYIIRRCEACYSKAPVLQEKVLVVKKQIIDTLNNHISDVERIRDQGGGFNIKTMFSPLEHSSLRMAAVFPPVKWSQIGMYKPSAGYSSCGSLYVAEWPLPESYLKFLETLPYSIWSIQKKLSSIEKNLADLERQAEELLRGEKEILMAESQARVEARCRTAPQIAANEILRQQQLADGAVAAQLRQEELRQRGDNDIRVQTTVGTALEDARTQGARAVQGDRDAAHAARHGKIIAAGKWMLVAGALSAVGGMGAYFGFRHFFKERPKIIRPQDTSISFGLKKAKYPPSRLDKLILPPALQKSVMQKFQGMEFAITKGLSLSNMLFYGPPGVGKSLAAQEFVRSLSDKKLAHHIIIRGPAFQQFKRPGQAVSAIRAIFEAAEHSYKKTKKPTIIDFEEAEILFADRGNPAISTEMSRSTLTTLLGLMNESMSDHIAFIATTNHKNDLDPAFRDRVHISNQIFFDVPGQEEREIFLRQYLNDVLVEKGFVVSDEVTNAIPGLAKSLSGLSGRQISGMITQAIYPLLNAGEFELTLPLFKEIIEDTMAKKKSV
jgi:hypothetical protein